MWNVFLFQSPTSVDVVHMILSLVKWESIRQQTSVTSETSVTSASSLIHLRKSEDPVQLGLVENHRLEVGIHPLCGNRVLLGAVR